MYYNMRCKTIWRQFAEVEAKMGELKKYIVKAPINRIRTLAYIVKGVRIAAASVYIISPIEILRMATFSYVYMNDSSALTPCLCVVYCVAGARASRAGDTA